MKKLKLKKEGLQRKKEEKEIREMKNNGYLNDYT